MTKDYTAIAAQYCEDVTSGKIPACLFVRQAVKRQMHDLERTDWNYVFDADRASKPCKFIELLTHIKGPKAGKRLELEPWQIFLLTTVFGWVDRDTGIRRFNNVYIEVPRKNGKSAISAGVGLYCLCADGEAGAEVYSLATTRDQAGEVYGAAHRMAEMNLQLRNAFNLDVQKTALFVPGSGSKFMAKSSDASTLDGLNTSLGIIDELHAHKTRTLYDVIETSIGARAQPLIWCITTAGFNLTGICMERRRYVQKILAGTTEAESQFGIIYTIDEGDEWDTEEALQKANPNWNVSVIPRNIFNQLHHAQTDSASENNFKTKFLDIWCNANVAWLDMAKWRRCYTPGVDLSEFEGKPCIYAVDLATKTDIAAVIKLTWRVESDNRVHYYVFPDFWLPSDTVQTSKNSQYAGWEKQDLLHVTDGPVIDLSEIEDFLANDMLRYETIAVAYDPWGATQLAQNLMQQGAPMTEIRQSVVNFSEPMKQVQALIYQRRLHTDGNPILEWMASNVVCHTDAKENVFPRKEQPEQKIDGIVALIMAMNRAIHLDVEHNYTVDTENLDLTLRF